MTLSGLFAPRGNYHAVPSRFLQDTVDAALAPSSSIAAQSHFFEASNCAVMSNESLSGRQAKDIFNKLQFFEKPTINAVKNRKLNANSPLSKAPHHRSASSNALPNASNAVSFHSKSKPANVGIKSTETSNQKPQRPCARTAYESLFANMQYSLEIFLDVARSDLAHARKWLDSSRNSRKNLKHLFKYEPGYFFKSQEVIFDLEKSSTFLKEAFNNFQKSFSALKEWSYSLEESSRSQKKMIGYTEELLEYSQELIGYGEEFSNYLIGLEIFTMEYRSSLQEKLNLSKKELRRLIKAPSDLTKLNRALKNDPRISSRKEIVSKQIPGYF